MPIQVPLRRPSTVCQEERWNIMPMHRLPQSELNDP